MQQKKIKLFFTLLACLSLIISSCQNKSAQSDTPNADTLAKDSTLAKTNDATIHTKPSIIKSLLGKALSKPKMPAKLAQRLADSIQVLQKRYEENPTEANAIWYGRHLAYNYQFEDAFKVYTEALEKFPKSYKLYRHRGHRYISVRKFDEAIADFTKAAELAKGTKVSIEPDGMPNKLNQPLTTTQFNIWYHLGLAHYLKGQYDQAIEAYLECMKFSDNDDTKCSTSDWLYMAYRRKGEKEKALTVLEPIKPTMKLIESDAYHKRLMMYQGTVQPETLLEAEGENIRDQQIKLATQGYGVGNWYLYNANKAKAKEVFEKVLQTNNWSAFGYIAAEVDLMNLQKN
ncbi:MAG TPA: hypothetical protein DCS93_14465 [Microscillaceae bacterium]|nr:hypothetical protein [Microscillaceae bacterium]